jgi:poly-gamma-glutamate synthesis protein (capsule biosynthesis protein)
VVAVLVLGAALAFSRPWSFVGAAGVVTPPPEPVTTALGVTEVTEPATAPGVAASPSTSVATPVTSAPPTTLPAATTTIPAATTTTGAPDPPESRTLSFTGDVLIHTPVAAQAAAYGADHGAAYDFRPMFQPVRRLLRQADLAICHLEVPLAAATHGVSGYPLFSSPPEVADAVAWAGYDGCSTASNHSVDQGFDGVLETLAALESAGLGQAGMAATRADSRDVTTYDLDGVTVAHLAATYWLNGLPMPAQAPWAVELIDVDRLLRRAERAREDGADFVVASIHCCIEYVHDPTPAQDELFRALLRSPDIDLVIGHHAHVVQPVRHQDGEYVVYGLGNFLSGMGPGATADGVIVTVEIEETEKGWVARRVRYTPTWVEPGTFRILPIAETMNAGATAAASAAQLTDSWKRTTRILEMLEAPRTAPTATPRSGAG